MPRLAGRGARFYANLNEERQPMLMEYVFFPRLSRYIRNELGGRRCTNTVNEIFTIARSVTLPINYPRTDSRGVSGLACGISYVEQAHLLKVLGRNWQTIKRNLVLGVELGFWRRFEIGNGYIKFSLRSPSAIAAGLGMETVGGKVIISAREFANLRIFKTQMVAEGYQKASFNAAKVTANQKRLKIYSPESLTSPNQITSHCPGKPFGWSSRYVVTDESKTVNYGISQKAIGELLGLAESTVQKHLSTTYRKSHGLIPIIKRQQAKVQPDLKPEDIRLGRENKYVRDSIEDFDKMLINPIREEVYRAYVNIYVPKFISSGYKRPRKSERSRYEVKQRERANKESS